MDGCGGKGSEFKFVNDSGIKPGPCDPYEGCPPPTEIECIMVDKVYEECKVTQVNTVDTDITKQAVGDIIDIQCVRAEVVGPIECEKLPCSRVRAAFYYKFTFRWTDDAGVHTKTSEPIFVEKIVRMNRANEPNLNVHCEIFVDCIECFLIDHTVVRCCIGNLIVFKLFAKVQLMVPAYGFCPEPPDCTKVVPDKCPSPSDWLDTIVWPPFYPEQDR